jgi:hypothetical protein
VACYTGKLGFINGWVIMQMPALLLDIFTICRCKQFSFALAIKPGSVILVKWIGLLGVFLKFQLMRNGYSFIFEI